MAEAIAEAGRMLPGGARLNCGRRLGRLELVALVVSASEGPSAARCLDLLPSHFWQAVFSWCFDRPNHTVLHGHVYQLVFTALRVGHTNSLRAFLLEYDLAAQLRCAFELQTHRSMRGHILLIANSIRVAMVAGYANDAATFLADNSAWRDFQHVLLKHSEDQVSAR